MHNLEDIVTVTKKCANCGKEAPGITFKALAADTTKPLGKMLKEDGYVTVTCEECEMRNADGKP